MGKFGLVMIMAATALAGCGRKVLDLPADPIERAATCGVVTAAEARTAAGVKGDLPAAAQGRIFHFPLLAASATGSYDAAIAGAVFKRMPAMSDSVTKRKWQDAKPECATAYPPSMITTPTLPTVPLDSALQCYMIVDFMRKGLADQGASYGEALMQYGILRDKLDLKVAAALAHAGIKGDDAVQAARRRALAAAAKLGQPGAVIEACTVKYR